MRQSVLRGIRVNIVPAALCCGLLLQPNNAAAEAMYAIDNTASSLQVLVYRGGLLSKLGHNHVVTLRKMQGCVLRQEAIEESRLLIRFAALDLQVDDSAERRAAGDEFAGTVADKDILGTRQNMLGPKLLNASLHPEVLVYAAGLTGRLPDLLLKSRVQLRQHDLAFEIPVRVTVAEDHLDVAGERQLTHSELRLRPFRAAFGALRVADAMQLRFRIRARLLIDQKEISDCQRALAIIDDDGIATPHETAE